MTETYRNVVVAVIVISVLACSPAVAQEARLSDSAGHVSIEPDSSWTPAVSEQALEVLDSRPNTFTRAIGFDLGKPGIIMFKFSDTRDLIPVLQIAVHDFPGLSINEASLKTIREYIEVKYSEKIGSSFRMFMIDREFVSSMNTIRLTGIYRWRANNIKIVQYLIPGSDRLYSVTYTAQEREFSKHLPEVEQMLSTIKISDVPLYLSPVYDFIRWILLAVLVIAIIWGILYANRIKPEEEGPNYSLLKMFKPKQQDSVFNPYMKKK